MTAAHTPGPWEVDDEYSVCARGRVIAIAPIAGLLLTDERDDELYANARLIAAAPRMYDALRDLLAWVDAHTQDYDENQAVTRAAHDALHKTEVSYTKETRRRMVTAARHREEIKRLQDTNTALAEALRAIVRDADRFEDEGGLNAVTPEAINAARAALKQAGVKP